MRTREQVLWEARVYSGEGREPDYTRVTARVHNYTNSASLDLDCDEAVFERTIRGMSATMDVLAGGAAACGRLYAR